MDIIIYVIQMYKTRSFSACLFLSLVRKNTNIYLNVLAFKDWYCIEITQSLLIVSDIKTHFRHNIKCAFCNKEMCNKEIPEINLNYNLYSVNLKWYFLKYVNGFKVYLVWNTFILNKYSMGLGVCKWVCVSTVCMCVLLYGREQEKDMYL